MADQTCGGAGCTCAARADGFCSEHCKEHAGHGAAEGHVCHCGHADCAAQPAAS